MSVGILGARVMAKITLAALSAQFVAEQSLTAATIKGIASRLEAQQRQIRAAFARIEALEKELAAKPAAAAASSRPSPTFKSTFLKRAAEIQQRYPGSAVKQQSGQFFVKLDGAWCPV